MSEPIVEISDGKLKGTFTQTHKGEQIYAFLGIPYAKPPVDELRFKAPLPVEPWDGIKDVTKDGGKCYQRDMITSIYMGSEDCLNLNVFTRTISDSQPPKPVLVFIHGGAFLGGSNDSKLYSPGFLMMEDIVFVSINYRVGILGFMKMNDLSLGVPGNAAFKDQILALKWIQKNIKHFGGDPNNVTIFGESAGAASVSYHILSPASKGLFHKATMQSGSVLNPWPHIRPNALGVMKHLKDDCKDESEILDFLLKVPVHELIEAQQNYLEEMIDDKVRLFGPCVESPNETAFLTRSPIDIITSGDYNKVPMIIGYNSNEGLIIALDNLKGGPREKEIPYDHFVPQQMSLPADSELRKTIIQKFRQAYSSDRPGDKYLMMGDAFFVAGIIAFAENLVKTCSAPIYFHRLNLCTSRNSLKNLVRSQEPGAAHADDLGYFFDTKPPFMPPIPVIPGSMEDIAINRYMRLWGNFVKYGNPTPDQNEFGITWKPITKDTIYYLDFDEELSLKTNPDEERMKLWREIFKLHENTKHFLN